MAIASGAMGVVITHFLVDSDYLNVNQVDFVDDDEYTLVSLHGYVDEADLLDEASWEPGSDVLDNLIDQINSLGTIVRGSLTLNVIPDPDVNVVTVGIVAIKKESE